MHNPTVIKSLLMLEDVWKCLTMLLSELSSGPELTSLQEEKVLRAKVTLHNLNEINREDLTCTVCALNSSFSSLHLMVGQPGMDLKQKGEAQL